MILNLSLGITSLLLKITKLVENHLQEKTSEIHLFSVFRKVKKQKRSDIGTLLCHIATNNLLYASRLRPWSGRSTEDHLTILWRIWTWMWQYGEYSWMPLSKQQFILGNDHDVKLRHEKILFADQQDNFSETEKLISGQTEFTGFQPDWLWRFKVDINKLVAQSTLSTRQCQELCLFRLGVCVWRKWDTILLSNGRNNFSGIQKPITSANWIELMENPWSFEWKIFPGFTTAGILIEIQKMMGELQCNPADFKARIIFMSMFNDIVWDHCMGCKRKWRIMWK